MKIDNIVLIESFFLPEYRERLGPLLFYMSKNRLPEAKAIIDTQVKDLRVKESIELEIDMVSFAMMLLYYYKLLKNHAKAFKVKSHQQLAS